MRDSYSNEEKRSIATTSTTQSVLWDMFLVLGILTAICCMTLHQAGLNDFNTPISIEYAEGNRLAILFLCSSLILTIATGLLYRYFGQSIASLLAFGVFLCLVTVVASQPHSSVHFYAFYATLFGAILAPLFALGKLKLWPSFWGLHAISLTVISLLTWAGTKNWELGGIGIVQRTAVIVALLSNAYALNHCRHLRHSG